MLHELRWYTFWNKEMGRADKTERGYSEAARMSGQALGAMFRLQDDTKPVRNKQTPSGRRNLRKVMRVAGFLSVEDVQFVLERNPDETFVRKIRV